MNEDAEALPPLNINEIFRQAFAVYRANGQLFVAIGLLYGLANVVSGSLTGRVPKDFLGAVFLVNILITSVASVLVISSILQIHRRRKFLLRHNLRFLQRFYFTFVSVSISQSLLSVMGVMLFIIPGIYFTVVFIFADILAVVERKSYVECFQESFALTRGYFWPILLFLGVIGCLSLVPVALTELLKSFSIKAANSAGTVTTVFIAPFVIISQIQLYLQVKKLKHPISDV